MATRLAAPFLHKYRHATRFRPSIINPNVESQTINPCIRRIYPTNFQPPQSQSSGCKYTRRHISNKPEQSSDYFPWCHSAHLVSYIILYMYICIHKIYCVLSPFLTYKIDYWCSCMKKPERIKNLDDLSGMPNNFRAR